MLLANRASYAQDWVLYRWNVFNIKLLIQALKSMSSFGVFPITFLGVAPKANLKGNPYNIRANYNQLTRRQILRREFSLRFPFLTFSSSVR